MPVFADLLWGSVCDFPQLKREGFFQFCNRNLHLITDPAAAEEDGVKVHCRCVDDGGKLLFHSDGRAASVDVTGQGKQFL